MSQHWIDFERACLSGARLRLVGLDVVEISNADFVRRMRDEAERQSKEYGSVCSDDLRTFAAARRIEPKSPNAWGAIFRGRSWRIVGRTKSTLASNHAREIKVWRWIGDR